MPGLKTFNKAPKLNPKPVSPRVHPKKRQPKAVAVAWGWFMTFWNFPVFRVQLNEGDGTAVMTWRAWQIGVYFYFWWNFT